MQDELTIRSNVPSEVFEFADFRLDVREHVLERVSTSERVGLPDKAFDTLCVLIRNAGRLVEKDELLKLVWADAFVEENNLNKSIHAIRRALDEKNSGEKFIETVKKYGFRFVAEVRAIGPDASSVSEVDSPFESSKVTPGSVHEFPHARLKQQLNNPSTDVASQASSRTQSKTFQQRRRLYPLVTGALLLVTLVSGLLISRYAFPSDSGAVGTLAVLPLKPLDAGDNYLGLGVADAIIRRMSQTGTLTVRPTSAVRRYLNEDTDALTAAKELDVDAVLEGTLQRADDRLRISVNLLRASDGKSLWTENFDMNSSDVFAIQDKVGQEVAANLRLRLNPSQRERFATRYIPNAIAYEYYLKGVYSFDQRGFSIKNKSQHEATVALFQRAVEADPSFALAHANLAYSYAWMAVYIDVNSQAEWVGRAKEEIDRANALDPQLAETHIAHHHVLLSANEGYQLEAATHEALLARDINPNIGIGDLAADFLHLGLEDLFESEKQRAFTIDPTSEFNKNLFGILYMNARRYDDWLAHREKYFDGKPSVEYLLGKGRLDEARKQLAEVETAGEDISIRGSRALLAALSGDHHSAEAEIPHLIRELPTGSRSYHHATYTIACIYALAGNSTEAVKWLRETAMTGFPQYLLFERDHYLDPIRQSPEFVQFMEEMKALHEKLKSEFAQ